MTRVGKILEKLNVDEWAGGDKPSRTAFSDQRSWTTAPKKPSTTSYKPGSFNKERFNQLKNRIG